MMESNEKNEESNTLVVQSIRERP